MSRTTGRGAGALWLLAVAMLLLCAGVWLRVMGWGFSSKTGPTPSEPGVGGVAAEREPWAALRASLEAEIAERRELARQVAELRDDLEAAGLLQKAPGAPPDEASARTPASPAEEQAGDVAAGTGVPRPGFDADALVAVGLDPARAADLRERWEEYELEKLYLRDQAAREGWMMSARHRREQGQLTARLRQEMGDEDYAALLYATREPNSVEVTEVLSRSPARDAGLEPGDQILRYDGQRIFRVNELRLATASGEAGEFVSIEVMRDGRPVTLRARRGPLGVLLRSASRPPLP